jgi:DNA-binding NtrC family response regulator
MMRSTEFCVGLVCCDCGGFETIDNVCPPQYLVNTARHVNWIALLGRGFDVSRNVCDMIATYFFGYHTLPVDPAQLLMTVGQAYDMAQLSQSKAALQAGRSGLDEMAGQSPAMLAAFQTIEKFAASDISVMIRGESGTGKELTARAIHRLSRRCQGPFVAVNCGALPKDLIQAELFGHEKGSFTGADRRRVGRIESAQGGTLFLDEIGDLPLDLQVNLLRFLQEKSIGRVGSSTEISVDVRVITATNADLERAVEEGRFREDLYYRLNVLSLEMPPLRTRGDDIELLANHFFNEFSKSANPKLRGFSEPALEAIKAYPWPGNVREMVNRIQRAVVMCEGKLVRPRDLGLDKDAPNCTLMTLAEARAQAEKAAIEATLAAVRNNVSKAARRLNISRVTLYRLMEQHAVDWQGGQNASLGQPPR